jgi:hypothetical protein
MPDFPQFDDNMDSKAAEQFAFANAEMVSTLTHTTREVAEHFLEWRKNLKKTNELKGLLVDITTKKVNKKKSNGGLREAAFSMFANGSTPKQVSVELGITYANAHYYKRAMAK